MSVARESLEIWEPFRPRLSIAGTLAGAYWLAALALSMRAYDAGFHHFLPRGTAADNEVLLTLAHDAGLWQAALTATAAFGLFLALLALRWLGERLIRRRELRDVTGGKNSASLWTS